MLVDKGEAVLITGASTGIGRTCALDLDRRGYRVFAGVRKESDAESLSSEASERLMPVLMDVVDYEAVAEAARLVGEQVGERGLFGLVNNAGIGVGGPLEFLPMEHFERQMRVNVDGQVAVTQRFLPLIRKARGRIVFMGSESGRFTLPMAGPYSASKFALEAVASAFRMELAPSRIKVSIIEPATIKTPIWDKTADHVRYLLENLPQPARQIYARELRAIEVLNSNLEKTALQPEHVARAVRHALTARWPRARYVVGMEARLLILWHRLMPVSVTDLVACSAIKMLGSKK